MVDASQHWNLFGYDLRHAYQDWRAAWSEFFGGERSWLRRSLDETVRVVFSDAQEQKYFRAGQEVTSQNCQTLAYMLPEHLVLMQTLLLPANVELELASLLALEVRRKSPFLAADTRYGWSIEGHENKQIKVSLLIVSDTTVQESLTQKGLGGEGVEVWAMANNHPIVINGFGESIRNQRYQRKTTMFATGIIYCLFMLCLLIAIPVVSKYSQLDKLEMEYHAIQQDSNDAVALRTQLRINNERAKNINELLVKSRDVYPIIERVSQLLDDNVWLKLMEIKNNTIRLEGYAKNAAGLMQKLSEQSGIEKVRAPVAIRFDNRIQKERFVINFSLTDKEKSK